MKKNTIQKIVSIFLAICMWITYMPMGIFAEELNELSQKIKDSKEVDNSKGKLNSGKIIDKTENSTIYQLDDGMKREIIHDSNIRFKENGKLIDYDPSLVKVEDNKTENNTDISQYAYENNKGDKKNYIPKNISEETPIILENNTYQITISPTEKETNKVKVEDENVLNIYDEEVKLPVKAIYESKDQKSSLEYISQDNGIKENVILNQAPESNVFKYEIKLDGAKPKKCELEESIVFIDNKTSEVVGSIDVPFMNDASSKAYSEDITYDIEEKEGEKNTYILTMTVDEGYLKSEDRQYPVKIDPTITWSGDSNIIDTYIISGTKYGDTNFYDSGTTAFPVGRGSNGIYRSLIKGRKLASTVDGKYVHKATLTMYETSNNDKSNVVRAYPITKNWSEKTVTWNNKPDYNTSDGYYGTVTTTGTLYKARVMDLTNYARKVASKSITDNGLLLRSSDESTTTGKYSKFFGSRHSGTDIRPKFTVEYYDGPTTATSLALSSSYLKVGQTFKLDWSGINSKSLNRVEYRIASYKDSDATVGSDIFKYADSPNLGATSSGSSDIQKIKELGEGCYRIYVRGVDNGGIKGTGKGATFHIDSKVPTLGSVSISPSSTEANPSESFTPTITWSNAEDTHFKQVEYSVNGGTYAIAGTAKSGSLKLPVSKFPSAGTYTIKMRAVDKSGNVSSVKTLTYYLKDKDADLNQYLPTNLSTTNYYGKNLIFWNMTEELPGNISYKVYRGETENFTPLDTNIVASGIKDSYCYDMLVGDGKTYYYKVEVIKTTNGKEEDTDVFTSSVKSQANDKTEWTKRLGSKDYLGYFSYQTPNGDGTIEKSQGNLTYSQTDIELPSSQVSFDLQRNYNSQSKIKNMFGVGWSDSLHKELYKIIKEGKEYITFRENDGSMYSFYKDDNGDYTCDETKDYELVETDKVEQYETKDNDDNTKTYEVKDYYEITTKDNSIYRFNKNGQLMAITNPVNESGEDKEKIYNTFLLYNYDNKGRLTTVMSNSGLTIEMKYKSEEGEEPGLLNSITLPDKTVLTYNYNSGYLTEFRHSSGEQYVSYNFEYNDNKYLSGIKDAENNLYSIGYSNDKANIVTYPNGETYNLGYVSSTKTTMTKKNENNAEVYTESTEYDSEFGKVTKETDASGNVKEFFYNNDKNKFLVTSTKEKIEYEELNNGVVEFKTKEVETQTTYNENEDVSKEVDEDGNETTYTYGDGYTESKPEKIVTKNGKITISEELYNYTNLGEIQREVDGTNETKTIYKYDEYGNISSTTDGSTNENMTPENDVNTDIIIKQSVSTVQRDADGNEKETSESSANINGGDNSLYDEMGRVLETSVWNQGLKDMQTIKYKYDFLGRAIETKTTTLGKSGETTKIETKLYNNNGAIKSETDANEITTTYGYDSLNRIESTQIIKNSNIFKTTKNEYTYGKVSINAGIVRKDLSNIYVEKTYTNNILSSEKYIDKSGNTIREKTNGIYTDYTYDNKGNVVTIFVIGNNLEDLSKGKVSLSLYNEEGKNNVNIENPSIENGKFKVGDNSIITTITFDEKGNESKITDGNGVTTKYDYDDSSKVKQVTLDYKENDSNPNFTKIDYSISDSDGSTTTKITDALDHTSYNVTNAAGLQVETKDVGGSNTNITTKYEYDSRGKKTKEVFSNGEYKQYEYDERNLLTKVEYFGSDDKSTLVTEYEYDDNDKLTIIIDYNMNGNTQVPYHYTYYEYDDLNRLSSYSEVNSSSTPSTSVINKNKISYSYDSNDRVTDINYAKSDNEEVKGLKFIYNKESGWLTNIKVKQRYGNLLTLLSYRDYTYDTHGKVVSIKDYKKFNSKNDYILKTYEYDAFDRVTSMKYVDSSNLDKVMESYSYTYDKNSNIKSKTTVNNYPAKDSDKINETKEYTYDKLGRLTKTAVTNKSTNNKSNITYEYDKVGNRKLMTKDGATTSYTYNDLNQLTSSKENKDGKETSNKAYSYDKNGNQTMEKDSVTKITVENTYDVDNRLSTCITTNGEKEVVNQENLYNGNGQRIQKKERDNVVNYFYQDGVVLYTTDNEGNKTNQNFLGVEGNIIGTTRYNENGFEYYIYNKDVQGSTTSVVGKDGTSQVAYDYDDFGVTTSIGNGTFFNEICYTGGIYDVSTGLYYLNARYYDPNDGRFISQDTYRGNSIDPSTLHLYVYCQNNPINYIDPSGHSVATSGIELSASYGIGVKGSLFLAVSKKQYALGWNASAGFDIGVPSGGLNWVNAYYPNLSSVSDLKGFSISSSCDVSVGILGIGGSVGVSGGSSGVSPAISVSKSLSIGSKGLNKIKRKLGVNKLKISSKGIVNVKVSTFFGYTGLVWKGTLNKIGTYKVNKTYKLFKGLLKIKRTSNKNYNYMTFTINSKKLQINKRGYVKISN